MEGESSSDMSVVDHEAASQRRYEQLAQNLYEIKDELKESPMSHAPEVNVFQKDPMAGILPFMINQGGAGMGGALGGGLGAGLLGGILGGTLLNRGGLFGNGAGDGTGVVTPTMLTAALNQVQDNTNAATAASERLNMARFDADSQREIQATVERTAAATQLAQATGNAALGVEIAKGNGEINTQVALTTGNLGTQGALNAAAIQTQAAKGFGDLSMQVALNTAAVATAVERTSTATALAFKDAAIQAQQAQYILSTAIKADGDLTRSLIIANNDAMLNRQLSTAQAEIIELRHHEHGNRRQRETEVNVTQTVNQNQQQLQAQQQQQQQNILNDRILCALQNLQIATATNQSLIIGNTGVVAGGAQTANPVNVRA